MKYLLPLLLMFNVVPKEPPERLTFEAHPNYIIEEMQHVDDNNEADNVYRHAFLFLRQQFDTRSLNPS